MLLAFIFLNGAIMAAQELALVKRDSIVKKAWIFGIGFNAVDDAGSEFSNLLNVSDNWNILPFPSRLSIGRYFESGIGIEAIGSYNRYREGKIVDGAVNTEDIDYFAIDLRASYDLNKIIGQTGFFDPYVGLGLGYTDANNQGRATYNAIAGFRIWVNDRIGFDFNSTGKWAANRENATNHIQHAAGLVYQFGITKGLSKKGEKKLVLLQEFEKEQLRIKDSTAAAEREAQEARDSAANLKREEEAAKLAAMTAKENAENIRRATLKSKIDALGNVYFRLNSSYLTARDKELLEKLTSILKEETNTVLKVAAHTDSRGTDEYNQWLSEKRARRTKEYLIAQGMDASRIVLEAYGESKILNHCEDGVRCAEKEHAVNRRSEFDLVYE